MGVCGVSEVWSRYGTGTEQGRNRYDLLNIYAESDETGRFLCIFMQVLICVNTENEGAQRIQTQKGDTPDGASPLSIIYSEVIFC
jgi:hypothetical protein